MLSELATSWEETVFKDTSLKERWREG